jgi:hypothetical protein
MLPQRYYFAFSSCVDCWQAAATVQIGGAVPIFLSRDGAKFAKKYLLFPHIAEDTWDKNSPPNLPNASSAAQLSNHRN